MNTPHGQGLSLPSSLSASSLPVFFSNLIYYLLCSVFPKLNLQAQIWHLLSAQLDAMPELHTQHIHTHQPSSFPCWVWYCFIALGRLPATSILSLMAQEQKAWEFYYLRHYYLVSGSSNEVHEQNFEG